MSRALLAKVRNVLASLEPSTSPSQQLRALQPCITIRNFSPWKAITKFPNKNIKVRGGGLALCPPYPYEPRHTLKEADAGLYGGAQLQSGNKISSGRNKGKTRRKWHPNVRVETIRSEALDTEMTIPITASCMRTIRKCGGLDQYVLGDKPARLKELGVFGWSLRWRVMNSEKMRRKYAKERKNLGLPPSRPPTETFEQAWESDANLRAEVEEEQAKRWQELRDKDLRFRQHVISRWVPKDKTKYPMSEMVPRFDEAAFKSITQEEDAQ